MAPALDVESLPLAQLTPDGALTHPTAALTAWWPAQHTLEPSVAARVHAARRSPQQGEELTYRVILPDRVLVVRERHLQAGAHWIACFQDVSAERLAQARARVDASLRALAAQASAVVHEMNNPLAGAINLQQLVLRLPEAQGDLREYVEEALKASERVLDMTRALRRTGVVSDEAQPVDCNEWVQASLLPLRRELREAFVQVDLQLPEGLPGVLVSGQGASWALREVVRNAAHALRQRYARGHPDKVVALRGALDDAEGTLVVDVEDHGAGLTDEAERRAFEPFWSLDPEREGLGLTLARELIRAQGGTLSLTRGPHGALVRLVLPAC